MKHLPVTLLTGFLGSGKTTLLAQLLAAPELADTVVIINEFGEVSIDHLIVAQLAESIVELRNGCLCCTIRGDLALTIHDLLYKRALGEVPAFRRIVIETSGLADPVPLAHTLMVTPALVSTVRLEEIVCVVDAVNAPATLREHATAADQVALADVLVISKTDLATTAELAATRALIAAINPAADCLEAIQGAAPASRLVGQPRFNPDQRAAQLGDWLSRHADHDHPHGHDHALQYQSHVCRHAGPLSLAGTSVFLNRVVNELGSQILRIKGIAEFVSKPGKPAIIHAVQNKFYPLQWLEAWPDPDHSSRIVFIGRALDTQRIEERFIALCL